MSFFFSACTSTEPARPPPPPPPRSDDRGSIGSSSRGSSIFAACMDTEPSTRPPPPIGSPRRHASSDFSDDPYLRLRSVFDLLADATEDKGFGLSSLPSARGLSFSSVADQVIIVAKLGEWLRHPNSAPHLPDIWDALGVGLVESRGGDSPPELLPFPSTDKAAAAIMKMFVEMSPDNEGIPFERFSRFVSARKAKANFHEIGIEGYTVEGSFDGGSIDGSMVQRQNASCVVDLDPNEVGAEAQVVLVQLKALRKLDGRNPYVKLALRCAATQKRYGKQVAKTAAQGYVEESLVWDPPEYRGFVLDTSSDLAKASVNATVISKGSITSSDQIIGTAVFPLKALMNGGHGASSGEPLSPPKSPQSSFFNETELVATLSDPETNEPTAVKLVVGLQIISKAQGFGFGMERVFELQRWRPGKQPPWGSSSDYLLPTDPGKWANVQGQCFWSLDEASPGSLPRGWVAEPWRASTGFGDGGWQYSARTFTQENGWSNEISALSVVRRRLWYRRVTAAAPTPEPTSPLSPPTQPKITVAPPFASPPGFSPGPPPIPSDSPSFKVPPPVGPPPGPPPALPLRPSPGPPPGPPPDLPVTSPEAKSPEATSPEVSKPPPLPPRSRPSAPPASLPVLPPAESDTTSLEAPSLQPPELKTHPLPLTTSLAEAEAPERRSKRTGSLPSPFLLEAAMKSSTAAAASAAASATPSGSEITAVSPNVDSSFETAPSENAENSDVSDSVLNAVDAEALAAPGNAAASQEIVENHAVADPSPSSFTTTPSAKPLNELDEASDKNEVSYCFNLRAEMGFEVAGSPLVVVSVAASGQADDFGVGVGWRVARVGGEPASSTEAFHSAIEKATDAEKTAAAATADGDNDSNSTSLVVVFARDEVSGRNTSAITKRQFRDSVFGNRDRDDGEEDEDEYDFGDDEKNFLEGYLLKKGLNRLNPWQSRWFVAQGHYLRYYKNMNEASDSNKCQAAVDLRLVARIDDAKGCIVTVPLPDKDMLLKASSQIEARAWVKNLRLHQN